MATIPSSFGTGGSGLASGGAQGSPDLATVLRDVARDLNAMAMASGGPITPPTASTVAAAADLPTAIALANDLQAKLNIAVTALNAVLTALGPVVGYTPLTRLG